MEAKHKWRDAHVGRESPQMAVRVTEEEKERLEELRQELRLTSKGQVIRAALDVLERVALLGIALTERDAHTAAREVLDGVERRKAENLRLHSVGGPEADPGLSGAAPVADRGEASA